MITEFCWNCKHRVGDRLPQCQHPDNGVNMVTGEVSLVLCSVARSRLSGLCGPSAALYEEKDPEPLARPWYKLVWAWITGRL